MGILKAITKTLCGCSIIMFPILCPAGTMQKFDALRKSENVQSLEELTSRFNKINADIEKKRASGYFHEEEIRELNKFVQWSESSLRGYKYARDSYLKTENREDQTLMQIISTQNMINGLEKKANKEGVK